VVQIITSLYHSYPSQRTVIITHSNAALNDIFEKVMARGDIDERYMIRLGSGERDLNIESSNDFTKTGRVAHSLAKRELLLEQVQQLSESLGVSTKAERGADGSPSYTCETAAYFYMQYVQNDIKAFASRVTDSSAEQIGAFPFKAYFSTELSSNLTVEEAQKKIEYLESMFAELAEYRPLEMLRSQRQKTDYFLMKQAKIVAMTCTHAAIARSHLVDLGFQYDNIVVEEAAQMMEVETFIPLLLQKGETDEGASSVSRLKRICLVGDHNQLPPVVKNMSFSKFSNLDQSLFTRLIHMGVPFIQLNKQGRARADIAKLYSWRYKDLGDLDHVASLNRFQKSNAGFAHTFQFINVENFEGKGETTPTAHFYQNVGEAEYVVAMFQYMVLIGYPAESISILTTYNGQKALLHDILSQRCGKGTPFSGIRPKAVSTVDQYQGQQNDIILLSLVRTESVGHLRDVRRLIVAVSRARLGIYVVGRQSLFQSCHELKPTMEQLFARPNKLELVLGEQYPCDRLAREKIAKEKCFEIQDVSHLGSIVYKMQENWVQG
jgi:intron-binding protein aquarius